MKKLEEINLVRCSTPHACQYLHPLILPLLREYLPAPPGITEDHWYATLHTRAGQIDQSAWSGPKFQSDFSDRVATPGEHAREILTRAPLLTRLFTRLSPAEMTLDPTFVERPDLDEGSVAHSHKGTIHTDCDGKADVTLPAGEKFALPSASSWPSFSGMPAALRVENVPADGEPETVVDNAEAISKSLQKWNDARDFSPPSSGCTTGARKASQAPLFFIAAAAFLALRRRARRTG